MTGMAQSRLASAGENSAKRVLVGLRRPICIGGVVDAVAQAFAELECGGQVGPGALVLPLSVLAIPDVVGR